MKKYVEIENIHAREVLNSKGYPVIEVEVRTEEGDTGRAIVPSNIFENKIEVQEVRDGDKRRYNGLGVKNAVNNINSLIAQEIEGLNVLNQKEIDEVLINLDGTENKSKLGANTLLGVSIATCKAAACNLQIPLYQHLGGISGINIPIPMVNILNGNEINDSNIKEFLIIPTSEEIFSERIRECIEIYWKLRNMLNENSRIKSDYEAINLILESIKKCGYDESIKIALSIDLEKSIDSEIINNSQAMIIENEKNILINPSQIGTITETIDKIRNAKSHGCNSIISSCNAETEDAFIADLAVGLNARYIKAGRPFGSENISKYNRLIRIEDVM